MFELQSVKYTKIHRFVITCVLRDLSQVLDRVGTGIITSLACRTPYQIIIDCIEV